MTEKTPQNDMRDKMSRMGRLRAGRLVQPTMSEMIQSRKQKIEGGKGVRKGIASNSGSSRRDRTASTRNIITGIEDRPSRTRRTKRKEQLGKLKLEKPKPIHRSD